MPPARFRRSVNRGAPVGRASGQNAWRDVWDGKFAFLRAAVRARHK